MAKPVDEEAHFRIDEMERSIAALPTTEVIAGIATGASAATVQQLKAEIAQIKSRQEEDIALDREVIQSNVELRASIKELIECMGKPTTREINAQLPSGPVRMTVSERRN